MAIDIYSPAVLQRTVADLLTTAPSFLLDRYFGEVSVSQQEQIFFDVMVGKPRLAPFVSPLVEGQIVQNEGYSTKSFSPAYIKDKRVLEDGKAVRRLAGQPIAGPLDPAAQRQRDLGMILQDQIAMVNRRLEWMASEALRTGSVTVTGEKYPTTVINFGRDAALTVTLAGTARWNDSAPVPLDNLETWAGLIRTKSGSPVVDVIMAEDVWTTFRKNADVKSLLAAGRPSPSTSIDLGPIAPAPIGTAQFHGTVGTFNIFTYADTYVNDAGGTAKYVPDNWLLMVGSRLEGVRHFGAIKDETAGFVAMDMYAKSWTQPDPAARFVMMQSAPLPVPYRINASLAAKVM